MVNYVTRVAHVVIPTYARFFASEVFYITLHSIEVNGEAGIIGVSMPGRVLVSTYTRSGVETIVYRAGERGFIPLGAAVAPKWHVDDVISTFQDMVEDLAREVGVDVESIYGVTVLVRDENGNIVEYDQPVRPPLPQEPDNGNIMTLYAPPEVVAAMVAGEPELIVPYVATFYREGRAEFTVNGGGNPDTIMVIAHGVRDGRNVGLTYTDIGVIHSEALDEPPLNYHSVRLPDRVVVLARISRRAEIGEKYKVPKPMRVDQIIERVKRKLIDANGLAGMFM